MRPVLYLDIDDTLLTYAEGGPRPARGCREFLLWALERFEVRWLTRWCPSGDMPEKLLGDLAHMAGLEPGLLQGVRGGDWAYSAMKIDGLAWLEHVAMSREFAWIEDEHGMTERDLDILRRAGFGDRYYHCNVTREADALLRVQRALSERFDGAARPPGRRCA